MRIHAAELIIEPRLIGEVGSMIALDSLAVEEFLQQLDLRERV